MYPTEFVKTQMQLLESKGAGSSMFGVIKTTWQRGGFLGFYRGLSSLVIGAIPKAGIRFLAFSQFSQRLADEKGKVTPYRSMLAGVGTGVCEAIIAVTPAETIKTKLIHDQSSLNPRYRGFVHGVSTMIRDDGLRGIYRGLAPTILRQSANSAVRFTVYGIVGDWLRGGNTKKDLTWAQSMFAGVCAGTINVYITMPFDVVKTRLQGLQAAKYGGVFSCFRFILVNEGVLRLWKGTVPRLSRLAAAGGISFSAMEQVMQLLNRFSPDTKALV